MRLSYPLILAARPFPAHADLDYLARYTHRVALTNDRLLRVRDGIVHVRWRDYAQGGRKKVLRLEATHLLRRFLLHVLPCRFRRIHHYGVLANRHKAVKLAACRRYFGLNPARPVVGSAAAVDSTLRLLRRIGIEPDRCRVCGGKRIRQEPIAPTPSLPQARAPTAAGRLRR